MVLEYELQEYEKDEPIVDTDCFISKNILFILEAYLAKDNELTIKITNSTYGFEDINLNIHDLLIEYLTPKKSLIYIKYLNRKLNNNKG